MDIELIRELEVIYFLDRNAWDVNNPEALIIEMEIIEENGKLLAYAEQGHETLQLELTEAFVSDVTKGERKYLFESRTAAQAHYDQEIEQEVQVIHNMPKDVLLQQFFDKWQGEELHDVKIVNAMKEKIKNEFGVNV